ncbi:MULTISPECIES: hypothetical protein [unclassified Mesorhizobium]|uniref:hypothetical protein n=2 Tax=unclassified Mesorhizobium TaxID=325217 RepID=UPI00112CE9CA|nr:MULTISPECIES: hypothetical protein [unclassified Mesorhizobium]TPK56728.1 hypothetical protein FJ550_02595 [Mesorhizobium sp. B2-5-2]TPL17023.1 hypothetical protein FJ945_26420 [Mesorhizobium sp. B2-4-9]TPL20005.1 hypothetical protein FJ946_23975 [Mesorhizobium sp. B2-4-7]TPL43916.1 hypothetical protein FJ961_00800 [Mesorhizobium sp. B2-4-5]TPM75657.1 hypothetical protein FJ968_10725 [Mesorhizobium sp. B2-1-6]
MFWQAEKIFGVKIDAPKAKAVRIGESGSSVERWLMSIRRFVRQSMTPGSIKTDGRDRVTIPDNDNHMAGVDNKPLLKSIQSDDFADALCARAERFATKVVVAMAICLTSTLIAGVYFLLAPS